MILLNLEKHNPYLEPNYVDLIMVKFVFAVLLALFSSIVGAQVSSSTTNGSNTGPIPPGGLPGFGGPEAYTTARDVTFDVTGLAGTIDSVSIEFSANHTFIGDLRVTLISPIGVSHLLFSRTGATTASSFGFSSDLDAANTYQFSDSASVNWWQHVQDAFVAGVIPSVSARTTGEGGQGVANPAPLTSLNDTFASTPPNGTWILRFEDGGNGDEGDVVSASLELAVRGVTRVVTNTSGSGSQTLREALEDAEPGDRIDFDPSVFDKVTTIQLLAALPVIDHALAINGPGAHLLTVRRGDLAPDFRIFDLISGSEQVSISGLGISNGQGGGFGGGVNTLRPTILSGTHVFGNFADTGGGLASAFSRVKVIDSTFSGNRALTAGGMTIQNSGVGSRLIGVTISNNSADSIGGLVALNTGSGQDRLEILNSTIHQNRAQNSTGGVSAASSADGDVQIVLRNTIVGGNVPNNFTAPTGSEAVSIDSTGFNLSTNYDGVVATTPTDLTGPTRLGPLGLNGGSVPTHPLLAGSPALDQGKAYRGGPRGGARAESRLFDMASISNPMTSNGADIGAVEMQAIVVTLATDSGAGSLRQAMNEASANGSGLDDILFAEPFFTQQPRTISLGTPLPLIFSNLTINGPGAERLTVQRAASEEFGIFQVVGGLDHVAMSGLTIRNGEAESGGGVFSNSNLSLTEVIVADNSSSFDGGGLAIAGGNGWIDRSSILNNSAARDGGGVAGIGSDGSVVRITQSTISGNQAVSRGGGVANSVAVGRSDLEIERSTIADNQAGIEHDAVVSIGRNSSTSFIFVRGSILSGRSTTPVAGSEIIDSGIASVLSLGFNLFTDDGVIANPFTDRLNADPGLAPLSSFGSPTPVHPLLPTSAALDAGNSGGRLINSDQRGPGPPRLFDLPNVVNAANSDGSDIGAYELSIEVLFSDRFEE